MSQAVSNILFVDGPVEKASPVAWSDGGKVIVTSPRISIDGDVIRREGFTYKPDHGTEYVEFRGIDLGLRTWAADVIGKLGRDLVARIADSAKPVDGIVVKSHDPIDVATVLMAEFERMKAGLPYIPTIFKISNNMEGLSRSEKRLEAISMSGTGRSRPSYYPENLTVSEALFDYFRAETPSKTFLPSAWEFLTQFSEVSVLGRFGMLSQLVPFFGSILVDQGGVKTAKGLFPNIPEYMPVLEAAVPAQRTARDYYSAIELAKRYRKSSTPPRVVNDSIIAGAVEVLRLTQLDPQKVHDVLSDTFRAGRTEPGILGARLVFLDLASGHKTTGDVANSVHRVGEINRQVRSRTARAARGR